MANRNPKIREVHPNAMKTQISNVKTTSSSRIEKAQNRAAFSRQLEGVSRQKIQAVFGPKPGAKISDVRARNMSREYDSMRKAGATHAEAVRSAAEIYDVTQKDSAAAIERGHAQRAGGKTGNPDAVASATVTKDGRAAGKRGGNSHKKKTGGMGDEWNRDEIGRFTGGKS